MVLPSDVLWQQMDFSTRIESDTLSRMVGSSLGPRGGIQGDVNTVLRSHLKIAFPFHVSSKIVEHLERFVANQSEDLTIADAPPPTQAGFCVLDEPLSWLEVHGWQEFCHAFTWGPVGSSLGPAVMVTMWMDADRGVDQITRQMMSTIGADRLAAIRQEAGRWWPVSAVCIPVRQPLGPLVVPENELTLAESLEAGRREEAEDGSLGPGAMSRARDIAGGLLNRQRSKVQEQEAASSLRDAARAEAVNDINRSFWSKSDNVSSSPAQAVGVERARSEFIGSVPAVSVPPGVRSDGAYAKLMGEYRPVDEKIRQQRESVPSEQKLTDEEQVRARAIAQKWVVAADALLDLATGPSSPEATVALSRVESARAIMNPHQPLKDKAELGERAYFDPESIVAADLMDLPREAAVSQARMLANLHVVKSRHNETLGLTPDEQNDIHGLLKLRQSNLDQQIAAELILQSSREESEKLEEIQEADSLAGLPTAFTPDKKKSTLNLAHRIVAIWRMMDDTMPSTHKSLPDIQRGLTKKLKRAGLPTQVTVVTLRREAQLELERAPEPGSVEWTHRWGVRGHWRTYHRGTEKEYKIWIRDYVKGPENKPFKQTEKVYDLVR